jgi:hemerythrin superfamily protein
MKASDLIEKQHRLVEDLFERFEQAQGQQKAQVFEEIAKNLVAHDAMEREIFYPACEEALGGEEDILGESLVEHGLVEFSIFRADKNKSSDDFDKYVTVLKEVVEHHVQEEESELLPKVRRAIETERQESLGKEMEARFTAALKSDFRSPLRRTLTQVLEGRTKTKRPAKGRGKAAANVRRTAARRSRSAARSGRAKTSKKGGRRTAGRAK